MLRPESPSKRLQKSDQVRLLLNSQIQIETLVIELDDVVETGRRSVVEVRSTSRQPSQDRPLHLTHIRTLSADHRAANHSPTPLGHYLRRMKAKLGPKGATMATAHKIAVIFYTMVKNQVEYDETLWDTRDAQRAKRFEAKLKRQAKQLGYELVTIEPKAA